MENNNKKLKIFLIIAIVVAVLAVSGLITTIIITNNMKNSDLGDNNVIEESEEIEQENSNLNEETKEDVNNENNEQNESVNKVSKLKIEEAKALIERYTHGAGNGVQVAEKLYGKTINIDNIKPDSKGAYLTDINYEEFKSESLKFVSQQLFDELSTPKQLKLFDNVDGKLSILLGGWSGVGARILDIKEIDYKENEKIVYEIEQIYIWGTCTINKSQFTFENVNGYYVISKVENFASEFDSVTWAKYYLNIINAGDSESRAKAIYGGDIVYSNENTIIDNSEYKLATNVNYEDFKNQALNKLSEEIFKNVSNYKGNILLFKEVDGKLAVRVGGWTGTSTEVFEASLKSNDNGKLIFTINSKDEMCIEKINGKYIITKYTRGVNK